MSLFCRGLSIFLLFVLAGCSQDGDTIITNSTVSPVAVSSVFPDEAKASETIPSRGNTLAPARVQAHSALMVSKPQ